MSNKIVFNDFSSYEKLPLCVNCNYRIKYHAFIPKCNEDKRNTCYVCMDCFVETYYNRFEENDDYKHNVSHWFCKRCNKDVKFDST